MFIYQIDKKEEEKHIELEYYSFNDNKESIVTKQHIPYQIYMQKEHFSALNIKSDNIILAEKEFLTKNKENVVKIQIKSKELFEFILKQAKEHEFPTYEQDIPFEHLELIEGKKIAEKEPKTLPKTLYVDIETIGKEESQQIVLISTFSPDNASMNKVYVAKEFILNEHLPHIKNYSNKEFIVSIHNTEKEMLEALQYEIKEFSPQMILGWNCIDFDFKIIKERMNYFGLLFSFSQFGDSYTMRLGKDFFSKSYLRFPGVLVLDGIQLLKSNYVDFEDFKLNTVAKEVLGDSKIDLEEDPSEDSSASISNKISAITHLLETNPIKLIEYNFKDSLLVYQILSKLKIIELLLKRSYLTNTPLQKITSPIATLDIMYLPKLHSKGFVAPTNFNFSQSQPIEGAFVLDPKPGYYYDIFVFDFKSLYPSIIMTFNIDPFTVQESAKIEAPNGAKFDSEIGILPSIIDELYQQRDIAKQNQDEIASYALKITMNSFYGAMASPKSRFHNRDVGGAITAFGREIILETNSFLESLQGTIVYNDTDSTFVCFNKTFTHLEEKKKFGKEIETKINKHFKDWCLSKHAISYRLTIELEKIFSQFFISSKKRYVGFDEIKQKILFTGLEAVRGDWTHFARNFQIELVHKIFSNSTNKELISFIHQTIKKLERGEFDNDLIYRKKITKPLEEYTKTTPPHVKAARELDNFQGRIVEYVMTTDGPKHVSLLNEHTTIDYQHYIEKQLAGVSDDLLHYKGLNIKEIIHSKKQKSLNDFFG
jgi:DNA polymerase-2